VEGIYPAKDEDKLRVVVSAVMDCRVP